MKKYSWLFLLALLLALTLITTLPGWAYAGPDTSYTAATSTRWPTVTRISTSTRWPSPTKTPSQTRWPTITRKATNTVGASPTRTPTYTRTSTKTPGSSNPTNTPISWKATNTRWPTVTKKPTDTRWPSATRTPTRTLIPSKTPTLSMPSGWLTLTNTPFGFQFSYPPDVNITDNDDTYVRMFFTYAPGTNLSEKYLELYVRDTTGGGDCSGSGTTVNGSEIINGISYLHQTGRDQGAGQIHEWDTYSTVMGNTCVIFNFIFHSGNPDMYYPTAIPVYDRTAESVVFLQMLNTFRWLAATPVPSSVPTTAPAMGPFSVVFVNQGELLNIRSGAGVSYSIVDTFPYNTTGVVYAGSTMPAGSDLWYRVQKPSGGTGWVNGYYLTTQVASSTFCGDTRVQSLFTQFRQAVDNSDGTLFSTLISPVRGVDVRLFTYQSAIHYNRAQATNVFMNTTQQNWGAGPSGTNTLGTFASIIQPKLQEVLDSSYESYCNNPKAAAMFSIPWPAPYTNFNYFSLFKPGTPGVDLDYRQWMVGIDYVNGQPYIVALVHVAWEP